MRKLPEPMDIQDECYDPTFVLHDVYKTSVNWLFPGYIPTAKISLLVGEPGLGKSQLVADIAARITTGTPMPFCSQYSAPAGVIMMTMEDDPYDTVGPRLEAAGADIERVRFIEATGQNIIADAERLVNVAGKYSVKLIVIDPLTAYLGDFDVYRDQHMRTLLTPLARIGTLGGASILFVHHLNKNERGGMLARSAGSHAITAVARSVMTIVRDTENSDHRILALVKGNLTAPPRPYCFHFEYDAAAKSTRVHWDRMALNLDAATVLRRAAMTTDRLSAYAQAEEFRRTVLAPSPMKSKDLIDLATERGISLSSLKRAKLALTKSTRIGGNGPDSYWQTELV